MNTVILNGRISKILNIAVVNDLSIYKFMLATERYNYKTKEKETDFIPCTAFRSTADFIKNRCDIGSKIIVMGHLKSSQFVDKNTNEKRYSLDVIVKSIEFDETKEAAERRKNGFVQEDHPFVEEEIVESVDDTYEDEYGFLESPNNVFNEMK